IAENKQQHQEAREKIQQQGVEVKKENAELEKDHKTKENNFRERHNQEIDGQRKTLFQETTDKIRNEALNDVNKMKGKY
ncbi:hypothetical protein, partial [Klebsiella pneumoniae]